MEELPAQAWVDLVPDPTSLPFLCKSMIMVSPKLCFKGVFFNAFKSLFMLVHGGEEGL